MKIKNQKIIGGNQQFADKIINTNAVWDEETNKFEFSLSKIKSLIGNGEIKLAIDSLMEIAKSDQKIQELIMLKAKFSKYEKDTLLELISFEESQVSFSKILNYLIKLSNQIEK